MSKRSGWDERLSVTSGGKGPVGHAGAVLVRQCADRTGSTGALNAVAAKGEGPGWWDRGTVLVFLAASIVLGAAGMSDINLLIHQVGVFVDPPSDSTVRRTLNGLDERPAIALDQARRVLHAQIPVAWMAADEVYGRSGAFRRYFEQRRIRYVVAVGVDFQVTTRLGDVCRADILALRVAARAWNRRGCGRGAKGPRVYDWAMIATDSPNHVLVIRRSITNPTDLAYFYAFVPDGQPLILSRVIQIAGCRWMVEEDFQQSKGQVGLDHNQVRRYRSWLRHTVLALAVHTIHAVTAGRQPRQHPESVQPAHGHEDPPEDWCKPLRGAAPGRVLRFELSRRQLQLQ